MLRPDACNTASTHHRVPSRAARAVCQTSPQFPAAATRVRLPAALPGLAPCRFVQPQQPLPALFRRAAFRIEQQIGLCCQPEQGSARNSLPPPAPVSSPASTSLVRNSGLRRSGNSYGKPCAAWIARSASRSPSLYSRMRTATRTFL